MTVSRKNTATGIKEQNGRLEVSEFFLGLPQCQHKQTSFRGTVVSLESSLMTA